ncbi:MFS transporter [Streptomyces stelliscabiei]|uniref:MFS transporter n=1 Tax=Streptomyces stelliscabiei TaxID=146820 RepID=UPI002FF0E416
MARRNRVRAGAQFPHGSAGHTRRPVLFAHLLLVAVIVLLLPSLSASRPNGSRAPGRRHGHDRRLQGHPVQPYQGPLPSTDRLRPARDRPLFRHVGLGSNTLGQFGTFLWTALAKGEVAQYSQLTLLGLPVGFLSGLVFIRVIDRPARHAWFAAGSALLVIAWALPAFLGPNKFTLVAVMLISGLGNAFAGDSIYRVWSQELFPTLLRATASGVTMAFTRAIAGLVALGTPAFALGHTQLFFGLLFGFMVISAVIGLVWVPRLPKAPRPEEPADLVGAPDSPMPTEKAAL